MKTSPSLFHALDLTAEELSGLLEISDSPSRQETRKRDYSRSPYQISDGIVVEVIDRGFAQESAKVAPRDLSAGGIGFLHRGLIAAGTPVTIRFPVGEGRVKTVTGTVVRCFCLTKEIHDIGVEFDKPAVIEPILEYARRFGEVSST